VTKSPAKGHSLKWRLVRRFLALQAAILSLLVVLVIGALYMGGHLFNFESEDVTIEALKTAVERKADGGLILRTTPALETLRAEVPDLWFIVRDRQGHTLVEGMPPSHFARIGDALDGVGNARLGWNLGDPPRANALIRWVNGAAGEIQIATGPGANAPLSWLVQAVLIVFMSFVLPALVIMGLVTIIATPIVVRRALVGLGEVADQAEQIDIDRQGTRLSTDSVPSEVSPLVAAVNRALQRLDEGHARHKRFLGDAAHELRTPIAILQTRLESLPESAQRARLLEDVARLAVMAEQLLDLQRIEHNPDDFARLDIVAMSRRVAADLAPLAIASGYHLAFEAEAEPVAAWGDEAALERVLANLVQNAIEHGGRSGTITITVGRERTIEVADEGPGIPSEQRSRIFEPFFRLAPRERGAGLGLHLVEAIIRLHAGDVVVLDSSSTGARFRITLPPPAA
jgi:signal transduction histidine kinase